jgi:crotonobetainyl-CoA:carnitine CoA-transferase CaiB-like acyl-CoA transferase
MTECSSDRVFKPLAGIRVADFSWVIVGPWLTKILACFGAEVIRIESRSRPDAIRLCQAIGSPAWTDQPEFATFLNRRRNREPLDRHLSAWTRQHSAEEVMRRLQTHGVRAGVVQHIADLTEHDPHLQGSDRRSEPERPGRRPRVAGRCICSRKRRTKRPPSSRQQSALPSTRLNL